MPGQACLRHSSTLRGVSHGYGQHEDAADRQGGARARAAAGKSSSSKSLCASHLCLLMMDATIVPSRVYSLQRGRDEGREDDEING